MKTTKLAIVSAMVLVLVMAAACVKQEGESVNTTDMTTTEAGGTAAAPSIAAGAGKTYPMHGVIVSRDPARNTVNIDNEDVPGVMAPMKMDYELRGAKVDSLPPDGTRVTMTLHEENGTFRVSGVTQRQ